MKKNFPHEIFKELYFKRWPVEVDYLFMKERIEIGNFSGKTALSVYQDFHAKVLAKNLTVVLASPAQKVVSKASEDKKHDHQVNLTQAFSKSKDTLFLLFERPQNVLLQLIQNFHALFSAVSEPIRARRKFKRKYNVNKRIHHMNYKPCR